jgi:DNA-binding MarR family transcriptional regulator
MPDSRRAAATSALEHELGVVIRRIGRTLETRARMVHPELPATSYSLLRALHEAGPQRSSALADTFAIDKGAVSRQVALLERLGLVTRAADPVDGRAQLLTITVEAEERLAEVDRSRRGWYEEQLAGWDTGDIEGLARQLADYNAALGRG